MSPSVTVRLLATQSDARLVELARHGHERAFEALVQRYRRALLGYCRRVLLPEARAEDALQQALLQAWLALQRGDDVRDARAWLYRIVHNTALNALRRSGYDYAELSEAITGAGAPQEDLDRRIAVREALAGLAALPAQQREALLRTAVEGASHAAVAAEMGLSEGALRGLVYRARTTLRTAVTAITPMPLVSWAAGAAGHGAVAELAVGGGSAGLAGLLAKGGAAMVAAGVLAAGVGTVAVTRHERPHARSHPARAAATRAAAPAADKGGAGGGHRPTVPAPSSSHRPPAVPVSLGDGGRAGGGIAAPRIGDGGGTGAGGSSGGDGSPASGSAPAHGGDGGGQSGDGGHDGSSAGGTGDGGTGGSGSSGSSGDGSGSGTGASGGDTSGSGSGDGSGAGGDGATSGSDTSGGTGTTTTGGTDTTTVASGDR
ncbi:MAG TPA: sigma-70 family RNA polymerase sigma factor [Conexibacter sp.]|nr:sigma-70 family RNA polymerase sigma factor [Conexibacter sp.]